jgi:hypothetical protein
MSGLPGSGKTTLVKDLLYYSNILGKRVKVFSYDNFRYGKDLVFGHNKTNPKKNIELCEREFKSYSKGLDLDVYILDNVNSVYDEFKWCIDVLLPPCTFLNFVRIQEKPSVCHKRCLHSVPFSNIMQMSHRMEAVPEIKSKIKTEYPLLESNFYITGDDV